MNCDLESSATCFTIGLNGVKIEGDGHSISGNGRGNGVESIDKTTVRIQNIAISGFSRGILLERGSHATVTNATLTDNIYGIEMKNTMNNSVSGNTITGNIQAGIYMDSRCVMNSLNNNVACPNGVYDISEHGLNSGDDNTCDDPDNWNDDGETGCTHTCFACSCQGASADFVCGDAITESCTLDCNLNAAGDCFSVAQDGITIDGAGYRITGNGSGVGFHLTGRTGVIIKNASVGEFSTGVLIDGLSHGNTVMENQIYDNVHGVRLENASQNTISENEIAFNQQAGIYTDADSEDNMFLSNDVCSPLGTDIYDAGESEGDDNACSTYYDYNDGAAGCTRACFRWQSDGDGDGASDADEMGPDSNDSEYDGDQDGNADLIDEGTASFHTYGGQGYATLEAPEGTVLRNVQTGSNPSSSDTPPGASFPLGFMAFDLENITPGDCIDAVLYLPLDESINTYFKYGPTPDNPSDHWYDFYYDGQTGAEIFHEASRTRIILHLCDGLRGDGDLSADGDISEPGAASHMAYAARFIDEDGNCGNENHPCHDSLQDAVDQVDSGIECIVSITGETYCEALVMNEDKTVILKGGWDETFTTQDPGHPAVIAAPGAEDVALSITAGTVVAECLELD